MPADLPEPVFSLPHVLPRPPLYRALNPIYARDPLSGAGAALHGGRFNRPGRPALYTAFTAIGAVEEANQAGRPFEPVTLVAYDGEIGPCLNTLDPDHLSAHGLLPDLMAANDWRLQMRARGASDMQLACETLIDLGYHGLIAPSFAPGAAGHARNLVLWQWPGLTVTDTQMRLTGGTAPA